MKNTISQSVAQHAVDVLNEALRLDSTAVNSLVNLRHRCNDGLADHDTIVVDDIGGVTRVGLLGFVNGIVTRQTDERIEALFEDGKVTSFRLRK